MATKLGEKIRNCRTEKEMTLDKLAGLANLSKSYLWELENREAQRPSVEKLQSIADALKQPLSFFLDDSVDVPSDKQFDEEFFRNYNKLEKPDKEKLRQILDVLKKPD